MSGPVAELHEKALVQSFIIEPKRGRLLYILKHPKKRADGLCRLAHFNGLDPDWAHLIPKPQQRCEVIAKLLRERGSPETCYVISENSSIDGSVLNLTNALEIVVGSMMGTLLSCIPGKLGYFEGEIVGERYLLERPDRSTSPAKHVNDNRSIPSRTEFRASMPSPKVSSEALIRADRDRR